MATHFASVTGRNCGFDPTARGELRRLYRSTAASWQTLQEIEKRYSTQDRHTPCAVDWTVDHTRRFIEQPKSVNLHKEIVAAMRDDKRRERLPAPEIDVWERDKLLSNVHAMPLISFGKADRGLIAPAIAKDPLHEEELSKTEQPKDRPRNSFLDDDEDFLLKRSVGTPEKKAEVVAECPGPSSFLASPVQSRLRAISSMERSSGRNGLSHIREREQARKAREALRMQRAQEEELQRQQVLEMEKRAAEEREKQKKLSEETLLRLWCAIDEETSKLSAKNDGLDPAGATSVTIATTDKGMAPVGANDKAKDTSKKQAPSSSLLSPANRDIKAPLFQSYPGRERPPVCQPLSEVLDPPTMIDAEASRRKVREHLMPSIAFPKGKRGIGDGQRRVAGTEYTPLSLDQLVHSKKFLKHLRCYEDEIVSTVQGMQKDPKRGEEHSPDNREAKKQPLKLSLDEQLELEAHLSRLLGLHPTRDDPSLAWRGEPPPFPKKMIPDMSLSTSRLGLDAALSNPTEVNLVIAQKHNKRELPSTLGAHSVKSEVTAPSDAEMPPQQMQDDRRTSIVARHRRSVTALASHLNIGEEALSQRLESTP